MNHEGRMENILDETDEKILSMMKGDARMLYQQIGDNLGISRVAAMKRVRKLEERKIIRGYNTAIYRDDETKIIIDIVTTSEAFEEVLSYVALRTAFVREIYTTSHPNHIHMVAASCDRSDLIYLVKMIHKECGEQMEKYTYHELKGIVKDVYGGITYDEYRDKLQGNEGDHP